MQGSFLLLNLLSCVMWALKLPEMGFQDSFSCKVAPFLLTGTACMEVVWEFDFSFIPPFLLLVHVALVAWSVRIINLMFWGCLSSLWTKLIPENFQRRWWGLEQTHLWVININPPTSKCIFMSVSLFACMHQLSSILFSFSMITEGWLTQVDLCTGSVFSEYSYFVIWLVCFFFFFYFCGGFLFVLGLCFCF